MKDTQIHRRDSEVLRSLAQQVAEIAALASRVVPHGDPRLPRHGGASGDTVMAQDGVPSPFFRRRHALVAQAWGGLLPRHMRSCPSTAVIVGPSRGLW